ncbi:pyrroline-5-carboxylate reductase [Lederbergia graminis]|uniref:Pyrroline-5-carboxylate reductase n=1 Tax=Lederbergia graminis TaxID=735518 RepID=A0ABW0LEL9_9BACI|nr:pyrroline-5-carboxylate reductase [Paenibacillus bovis]HLU22388.1 pyrroline-5-carboxylate reductase [Bacillaceae bacterium]
MKIAFVGAGSMAEAIIAGMLSNNICPSENIYVTNRHNEEKMTKLRQKYGISSTYDMKELLKDTSIIILAVKPKDANEVLEKIRTYIRNDVLIVSVMAGISIEQMKDKLGMDCAIARAMPNTSASVGLSATALVFNNIVTEEQRSVATDIFSSIGMTTIVEEHQLDIVTGLSGSGPAYIYYIVEAMEQAAIENGLDKSVAKALIIQTLSGAAEMLKSSGKEPAKLRENVTSPGGTTEAGLHVLDELGVGQAFIKCIEAATNKSRHLGHSKI